MGACGVAYSCTFIFKRAIKVSMTPLWIFCKAIFPKFALLNSLRCNLPASMASLPTFTVCAQMIDVALKWLLSLLPLPTFEF